MSQPPNGPPPHSLKQLGELMYNASTPGQACTATMDPTGHRLVTLTCETQQDRIVNHVQVGNNSYRQELHTSQRVPRSVQFGYLILALLIVVVILVALYYIFGVRQEPPSPPPSPPSGPRSGGVNSANGVADGRRHRRE